MSVSWYAALDAGSSSLKCLVLDAARPGAPWVLDQAPVTVRRPAPGLAELDPQAVWAAAQVLLRHLARAASSAGARVISIGLTGQISGLLPMAADGSMTGPCMTWEDQRCAAEASDFAATFGARHPGPLGVALPTSTCWPAPKLKWLARHAPATLAQAWRVLQLQDYLFFQLTGQAWSSPVTFIGLADVRQGTVQPEVQDWCQAPAHLWPTWQPAQATLPMAHAVARDLGWPAELAPCLGIGTGDMMAGFLGCGLQPGDAVLLAGTTEIMGRTADPATPDAGPAGVARLPYAPTLDLVYGSTTHGGASLHWLQRLLGIADLTPLLAEAASLPPGAEGLLFIPHLAGARAPMWDPLATGALLGLRASHGPAHFLRAILEGCAYNKAHILTACAAAAGPPARRVVIAGGGARIPLWNQLRAAILGLPLLVLPCVETSALGALFLAAASQAPDLRARYLASHDTTLLLPDPAMQAAYAPLADRFRAASDWYQARP
jgi:xylulokinase